MVEVVGKPLNDNLKAYIISVLKLCLSFSAFYLVLRKLDFGKLLLYLEGAKITLLLAAVIASHVSLIFSAMRSKLYFKQYGLLLSDKFCIALYYLGTFYNILLPGGIGGDGYRVYLLSKLEHFSKIKSLRVILYERVNGFYVLVLFGLIGLLFSDFISYIPHGKSLTWLAIIFITPCYLFGVKYVLKDKVISAFKAVGFSFFIQLFQIIMVLFIISALSENLDYDMIINFTVLFIISSIVAILPISIGGAGLRELTFLYGLSLVNSDLQEMGVAIALLVFAIYIITGLPGVIFIYNIKKIHSTNS